MLTGGYELVHQAMGAEAKAAVWEAERLARRNGHTHVTPVHLASAILCSTPVARALLLSSSTFIHRPDLLPRCFDAALSHLPVACPPPPPATPHSHSNTLPPPLPMSNALVTAIKRAHKRCTGGCRRGRRPQLLADVKIQLEHLVVSILDDPSVHRAMKQPSNNGSRVNLNPNVVDKGSSPAEQSNQPRAAATVVVCDFGKRHEPLATNLSCHSSGDHPSQAKTGEMLVPFVTQSAAMAVLSSWLCHTKTQQLHATAPLFSGDHPSQAKKGELLVPFVAQSAAKTSLPPWVREHQDAILKCCSTTLEVTCHQRKFTDLSANNFKIMCDELELRVPWHKHIVPHIVSTVLLCRSGMMRRASNLASSTTWLFFQGDDDNGKRVMASELSNLIFGSHSMFSVVNFGDNSATGNLARKNKRSREGLNTYVMRRLMEGKQANPHCVMFINGINQLDYESVMAIKNLIATGKIMGYNGNEMITLEDTIVVLSTEENSWSRTMVSSTLLNRESVNTQKRKDKGVESRHFSFDLNTSIEDVGEVENLVGDTVGIKSVVDGVFRFD